MNVLDSVKDALKTSNAQRKYALKLNKNTWIKKTQSMDTLGTKETDDMLMINKDTRHLGEQRDDVSGPRVEETITSL